MITSQIHNNIDRSINIYYLYYVLIIQARITTTNKHLQNVSDIRTMRSAVTGRHLWQYAVRSFESGFTRTS